MAFKIIEGNLLDLAEQGEFDVIIHGCNCRNNMGSGIAGQIATRFPEAFDVDKLTINGDYNKMGNYTYIVIPTSDPNKSFILVNLYTQFNPGKNSPGCEQPLDYEALTVGLRKIFRNFGGSYPRIGLPWIGCGLARGSQEIVEQIIRKELSEMDVTIVEYKE